MADNGVNTTDLTNASLLDEVIGNRGSSTVVVAMYALAQQLLGSGPLAEAIALDGQTHWRNTFTNLNSVTGQTSDNGFVVNDGANNGIYRWNGSAWSKVAILPGALGFQNLNDTSDADKPVSTAQAAALALKASQASVDALSAKLIFSSAYKLGDRTASISATSADLFKGVAANTVNGSKLADISNGVQFNSAMAGKALTFDFGYAARCVFTQIRFWWNGQRSQGVVKVQVSLNGTTWTDVSGNINWGAALTASGSDFKEEHDLTVIQDGPNPTGFRYLRILGVSGSYVAIEYLTEVEFKTAEAANHLSIGETAPAATRAGQVLTQAGDEVASVYWSDPRDQHVPLQAIADMERLLASERYSGARFHADSVYGGDAKNGLSSATAKKTITGLLAMAPGKGDTIGLRAGSTFADKTIEPAAGFKKLIGFGEGPLPLIDCAPAVVKGNFVKTAGRANVYEITLTREDLPYVNDPQFTMWEVSAGVRKELRPVTSQALADATPGTVYFATRTAATSLAYIHPYGSTNPISDGKTYKASKLKAGVGVNGDGGASTNPAFDGQYIEGIHASGQVDGHGSILSGDDTTMKRSLASFGNKHNIIFKSGYAEDSIAYGWGTAPFGGQIAWTIFRFDAEGRKARLKRCMAIASEFERGGTALYCHGSLTPNGQFYDEFVTDQFVAVDCGGIGLNAKTQRHRDMLIVNRPDTVAPTTGTLDIRQDSPLCEIDRLIFWGLRDANSVIRRPDGPDSNPSASNKAYARNCVIRALPGSNIISGSFVTIQQATTLNLENNFAVSIGSGFVSIAQTIDMGAGSTIKDNIVVSDKQIAGPERLAQYPTDGDLTVDFNVYVSLQPTLNLQFTAGATTYSIVNQTQFSAYKAGSGKDTNSILITANEAGDLFAGGLDGMRNGDMRLNPLCDLRFTNGQRVVDRAGVREHLDWNRRIIVPGAPSRIPVPPLTLAQSDAYCQNPALWNWYA